MALVGRQSAARPVAEAPAKLPIGLPTYVNAQRACVTVEAGPPLYLAKLFGSGDTEAVVRLITALLVLVLDPLAVLLMPAASRSNWRFQ